MALGSSGSSMGSSVAAQKPHLPTLVWVIALVIILFFVYHMVAGRKR